jgi:hypothetical protein
MHRCVFAVATAALLALPLAACSSGSESSDSASGWQDQYRQAVSDDFANATSEQLDQSCQSIATNELNSTQAFVDFLKQKNPDLTVDQWLSSLADLQGAESPDLSDIVPDDATVDEVLTITGDAHLAECQSRG